MNIQVARILDEDPNTKIGFLGSAGHDETFRLWMWDQVKTGQLQLSRARTYIS